MKAFLSKIYKQKKKNIEGEDQDEIKYTNAEIKTMISKFKRLESVSKTENEENAKKMEHEYATYETAFEGLNLENKSVIFYGIFFTLRRLILSFVCLFLDDYPFFQIVVYIALSQFYLIYLVFAKPYVSRQQNIIEQINEQGIFCLGLLGMCMIGLAITFEDRETQGQFMTALVSAKLLFNAIYIVVTVIRDAKKIIKAKCAKRKQKKKELARKKELERNKEKAFKMRKRSLQERAAQNKSLLL